MDRKLGLPSAIAVCIGLIVSSSVLLSLGQGIGMAGKGFVLSIGMVFIVMVFQSLSFNELHSIMPNVDGGLGQYTKAGLGSVASIVSNTSAYVMVTLFAGSAELIMCGMVIKSAFLPTVPVSVISLTVLLLLTLVNYMGIDMFSKVQNIIVSLLLLSFVVMGGIGFFKLGTGAVVDASRQTEAAVSGFGGYVAMTSLAFWVLIGVEYVIPLAKDIKNPKRNVLLAMILSISILFVIESMLGLGMANYVPLNELASSQMPHIVYAENLLGSFGKIWMGIVTALATISLTNTVLGSVPRMMSGMAENDLLPSIFTKRNKNNVAIVGLLFLAICEAIMILSGFAESSGLTTLLLTASCFWITSYMLINITVLILRRRFPDLPGRNKKLTLFGIPQILAIIADVYMIAHIAEGDAQLAIYKVYGIILVIMIFFATIWVKFVKRQQLVTGASLAEIMEMK